MIRSVVRRVRGFWKDSRGAVTAEYVLLCLLLAAGSVMMVISFSRAVARRFALVSYAMSGYSAEQLSEAEENFRKAQDNDAVVAETYSDYMHGEKVNQK